MSGPTRWNEAQELFHRALAVPPADRERFLEEQCADALLRAEVLELLAEDAGHSILDADIEEVAADLLESRLPTGSVLGPYRIERVLGEGGMGIVYLASRMDLGNPVAVKVLRDGWVSPGGRARFLREQRLLARLNHPAIARLLDAGAMPDGTPYFVIEFVDGVPLTEHCETTGASLRERLRLFREVCEAVQFAHGRAIIHRDLKPSNILVGGDGSVKLLDFGIARQQEELASGDVTRTGQRFLTPGYAAPEQVRGEAASVVSDVYSLGIVLHELLTGEVPSRYRHPDPVAALEHDVVDESLSALAKRVGRHRMLGGERVARGAWRDLDIIVRTAVDAEPSARYASVEALGRDIDHFLRGEPLDARAEPWSRRARKYVRRNWRAVVGTALAACTLIGSSVVYATRIAEERDRARLEASKARQVSDYLFSLFEAADPYGDDAEPADVRDLLLRGEARADELDGEPLVQAQMLDVLGRVQTSLGDYERAESLLERALAIRRDLAPGSLDVAETLSSLGILYFHQGRLEDAETVFAQALAIRERALPADHPDLASTLDDLGVIVGTRGDYARAGDYYERALNVRRTIHTAPHADLGESLNNMAVNLYNLGDLEGAERYYREAVEVDRAVFGPEHPTLATDLANFGRLHQDRGDYDEAESLLEEALRIRQTRLGEEHYETGLSHSQLAGLLAAKGDTAGARIHYQSALRIQEALLGPDHPSVATTLNGLALLSQRTGDYDAAEATLERVVATYRTALGPEHRFVGVAIANLAALHYLAGDPVSSEHEFREAIRILEAVHPPDHPELGYNIGRFGAALLAWGRAPDAEPYLRRGVQVMESAYGPDDERTREAQKRVAELEEVLRNH